MSTRPVYYYQDYFCKDGPEPIPEVEAEALAYELGNGDTVIGYDVMKYGVIRCPGSLSRFGHRIVKGKGMMVIYKILDTPSMSDAELIESVGSSALKMRDAMVKNGFVSFTDVPGTDLKKYNIDVFLEMCAAHEAGRLS